MRVALSAFALVLFLALFGSQLGMKQGPIRKSYASVRVETFCKKRPDDCPIFVPPSLMTLYSPTNKATNMAKFLSYSDPGWHKVYETWNNLLGDKRCECINTLRYSRWYAFNTVFPCGKYVPLCRANASMSFRDFAVAALSADAPCYPEPVADMSGAGLYLTDLGNKLNNLQNFTFTSTTRNLVHAVGNSFCLLLKSVPVVELPALPEKLVSAEVLHMNAVRALSTKLDVLVMTALPMAFAANASDAESAYVRQYLDWHSSRVISQAYSEVQIGADFPWRSQSSHLLDKPLLLPLRVQKAFTLGCLQAGKCNITEFLGKKPYPVWQFEMFDYASYSCRPTQCVTMEDGSWVDVVGNVVALFGSLVNAVLFVGLPVVWALLCWYGFTSSVAEGSAGRLTAPPSGLQVAPDLQTANASSGEPLQVLGPSSMTVQYALYCNMSCHPVALSEQLWSGAWACARATGRAGLCSAFLHAAANASHSGWRHGQCTRLMRIVQTVKAAAAPICAGTHGLPGAWLPAGHGRAWRLDWEHGPAHAAASLASSAAGCYHASAAPCPTSSGAGREWG